MKQSLKVLLVSISFLAFSPSSLPHPAGPAPDGEPPRIEVHIYNDVRIPDENVSAAEEVASWVFRQAGIELGWSDCTVTRDASGKASSTCESSVPAGVLVYFVGSLEAHFESVDRNALGYSIIPGRNEPATMAYVSYTRIQKLSVVTSAGVADLLGLAVAHEIGHLMFGSLEHANQGIMRAFWSFRDLQSKSWHDFEFTRDQASRLRSAARARLDAAKLRINNRNTTE